MDSLLNALLCGSRHYDIMTHLILTTVMRQGGSIIIPILHTSKLSQGQVK